MSTLPDRTESINQFNEEFISVMNQRDIEPCKHSVTAACATFPNVAEYIAQLERERDEAREQLKIATEWPTGVLHSILDKSGCESVRKEEIAQLRADNAVLRIEIEQLKTKLENKQPLP